MKNKLNDLWGKVVENREIVIRVGIGVAGAVIGAGIATMIHNHIVGEYLDVDSLDMIVETPVEVAELA